MSLSKYVIGFAQALEAGTLITNTLNKAEQPMHIKIAAILRKALKSDVMASVADDYHDALMQVLQRNAELEAKINGFAKHLDAEGKEIAPQEPAVEEIKESAPDEALPEEVQEPEAEPTN